MGQTTFTGPVKAGTRKVNEGALAANVGSTKLVQSAVIDFDTDLSQSAIITLPRNSQILNIYMDPLVLFNSATTTVGTFGSTAGGTEYAGSLNMRTANRKIPTFTVAQLAATENIGNDLAVHVTLTSVGQPSAGSARAVVEYVQRNTRDQF